MVDGRLPGRLDVPAGAVDVVDARLSSSLCFFASVKVAGLEVSNDQRREGRHRLYKEATVAEKGRD